jgi:hypothetical protein
MSAAEILLGHITDVQGRRLTGRLLSEQSEASALWRKADGPVGQVGTFVAVQQPNGRLLSVVQEIHGGEAGIPTPAGGHISLTALGEIRAEGKFRRGVSEYPLPGAEIRTVAAGDLRVIFDAVRSFGFKLGSFKDYTAADVFLDPGVMCGRHFAILGQSGSGKSWAVATVVQRLVEAMPRAHIILLDLHGEYCWVDDAGREHSAFAPDKVRYLDARTLEIPYWLMTFGELVELLIDRSDSKAPVQTAFLRDVVFDLKSRSGRELGLKSVSVDSPVYFPLLEVFRQFKEANELRSDFGKTKGPLYGHFDELLIKLQSRLNDARYDFLINPSRRNHSGSLMDLLRDFVGLGEPKAPINVIDLSPVPFDVRPAVSAQIGRLAFEFNYWNPRHREFPILLICEEAHVYIPRDPSSQFSAARKSMERIAKEGRKYGVGLGVVSQRPQELSETVLSQCGTYLCLRLTNPDDQNYVRQLVPEGESDFINVLTALGRGEAMALGEAVPVPLRFQFDPPCPPPNSSDVDYFGCWRDGPEDLDIDGIVRRWWQQGR